MTMGEKILSLRKARGWNQEELAENVGVTRQAVSRWEADRAKPDTDKIIALCNLFGVSSDYLLRDGHTVEGPVSTQESQRSQTSILGDSLRHLSLKQWIGGISLITGVAVMLILRILSGVYPCIWNGYSGLHAFLMCYDLAFLWWLAVAAMLYGSWVCFIKKYFDRMKDELFNSN